MSWLDKWTNRGARVTIKISWTGAGNDKCLECLVIRKDHDKKKQGHSFKEKP